MADAALSLLLEEFSDGDIYSKKRATERLHIVAKILGSDKIRSELLPWIDGRITGNDSKTVNGLQLQTSRKANIDGNALRLTEEKPKEDDEVLYMFAEKLGEKEMISFVANGGKQKQHLVSLLKPLANLCCVEETFVREMAVESSMRVIRELPIEQLKTEAVNMITSLAQGEWFSERISACGLVAGVLVQLALLTSSSSSSNNNEVKEVSESVNKEYQLVKDCFVELCKDSTPMVKRAAARELGNVAAVWDGYFTVKKNSPDSLDVIPIPHGVSDSFKQVILDTCYCSLTVDTQESVRIIAIGQTANICCCMNATNNDKIMLKMVKEFCFDASWRVRFTIAKDFFKNVNAFDGTSKQYLVTLFADLLQDPEAEVRACAGKEIIPLLNYIDAGSFADIILPVVNELVMVDTQSAVRQTLADVCIHPDVIAKVTEQDGVKKLLLPIWEEFLKGSCSVKPEISSLPEVRYKVLRGLGAISSVLGPEFIVSTWSGLLREIFANSKARPPIGAVSENGDDIEHPQWRLREAIVYSLDDLAKAGLEADEFIVDIWRMALGDEVSQVRIAAANLLGDLCCSKSNVGLNKVVEKFIPVLLEFYQNAQQPGSANYLHRIVFLQAAFRLSAYQDAWLLVKQGYERAFGDKVPNIRLKACTLLNEMNNEVREDLIPKLVQLAHDNDPDVSRVASQLLK